MGLCGGGLGVLLLWVSCFVFFELLRKYHLEVELPTVNPILVRDQTRLVLDLI